MMLPPGTSTQSKQKKRKHRTINSTSGILRRVKVESLLPKFYPLFTLFRLPCAITWISDGTKSKSLQGIYRYITLEYNTGKVRKKLKFLYL